MIKMPFFIDRDANSDFMYRHFLEIRNFLLQNKGSKLYKNKFRVCAIYDTIMTLDGTDDLKEHFGNSVREPDASAALASFCYDVLNDIILDASLDHNETNEYDIVKRHMKAVDEIPQHIIAKAEVMYVFPRQYLSHALFAELIDEKIYFLMHMQDIFRKDLKPAEDREKITFVHNDKEYVATVFTTTPRSGKKETFATNIEEQYLDPKKVDELYFKQWNVSLKLRLLDGKSQLEYVTGQTADEIYQNFWQRVALANALEPTPDARKRAIEAEKRGRGKHFREDRNSKDVIDTLTERFNEIIKDQDRDEDIDPINQLITEFIMPPDKEETDSTSKRRKHKRR